MARATRLLRGVAAKHLLACGLIGAFGLVTSLVALQAAQSTVQSVRQIDREIVPKLQALDTSRVAALRIVSSTSEYAFVAGLGARVDKEASAEELAFVEQGVQALHAAIDRYASLASLDSDGRADSLTALREAVTSMVSSSRALLAASRPPNDPRDALERKEQFERAEAQFLAAVDRAAALDTTRLTETRHAADGALAAARRWMVVLGLVIVAASLAGYVYLHRTVVRPLRALSGAAKRIGDADFDTPVEAGGEAEVADLGVALQRMVGRLRESTVSADYLDNILNSMADCLLVSDASGHVVRVNRATTTLLGYTEADLIGRHVNRIVPSTAPVDLGPSRQGLRSSLQDVETTFTSATGVVIPVRLSVTELRSGPRAERGVVWVVQDSTNRKRTETQLQEARRAAEQASEAKSLFLSNMSHELRTPLNAIIGYSEMLLEAPDADASEVRTDIERIRSSGRHLLALVNDILDLSKLEAGRMEFETIEFDLRALVDETAATLTLAGKQRGNRITVDIAEEVGLIVGDPTRVRQVLFNLLSNACKFTEKGAIAVRVEVEGADRDRCVAVHVTDTGIGMTADQVAGLFKNFVQADASVARKYGGTGLGLALSRRLAELMHGTLDVVTVAGEGSAFTFRVPTDLRRVGDGGGSADPLLEVA